MQQYVRNGPNAVAMGTTSGVKFNIDMAMMMNTSSKEHSTMLARV